MNITFTYTAEWNVPFWVFPCAAQKKNKQKLPGFFPWSALGWAVQNFLFLFFFKFLAPTLLFTHCHVILCVSSCFGS